MKNRLIIWLIACCAALFFAADAYTATNKLATESYADTHLGSRAMSTTTPDAGQVVAWSGSTWQPTNAVSGGTGSYDTFSNLGSSCTPAGATGYPSNGGFLRVCTGTIWAPVVGGVVGVEPPATATLSTIVGSATATLTKTNGTLIADVTTTGSFESKLYLTTAPTPSTATIDVHMMPITNLSTGDGTNTNAGVCLRNATSTKFARWAAAHNGNENVLFYIAEYWASNTSRTAATGYYMVPNGSIWLRIAVVSTNTLWQASTDRATWVTVSTVANNTVYGSGNTPDQYGLCPAVAGGAGTHTYTAYHSLYLSP